MLSLVLGGAFVIAGFALYSYGIRLLFRRWRAVEPREWLHVMRHTRRRAPFRWFVRHRTLELVLTRWELDAMPPWSATDRVARRAVLYMRVGPLTMAAGFVTILLPRLLS